MEKQHKKIIKRSQRDYGLAFKLQVVQQVEKGELTYKKAQRYYGIQGQPLENGNVNNWTKLTVSTPGERSERNYRQGKR